MKDASLCQSELIHKKYAFILGRNPELSIAELGAVLDKTKPAQNATSMQDVIPDPDRSRGQAPAEIYWHAGHLPAQPQEFLDQLGGTTEILEIFEKNLRAGGVETSITDFLKNRRTSGKLTFALNLLPENKKSNFLKFLLPKIKRNLRASGISSNFLNNNFENVNAVAAKKQGLVKNNTNLWVIDIGEGRMALGFSIAMQDFEAYSKRDYGKPFRDVRAGMLPPKLAQIMVNLALAPFSNKPLSPHSSIFILDPFCGTGTILMEALLMGYSVIGCDADERMIEGAKQNIDWLRRTFPEHVSENTTTQFFQKDATALSTVIASACLSDRQATKRSGPENCKGRFPPAVVTEPLLGPPLSELPQEKFLNELTADLGLLYEKFFADAAKWLPKGAPVVFIFPYWKGKKGAASGSAQKAHEAKFRIAPSLIAKIEALGYSKSAFAPLQTTSLFYDRPDSVVGREIVRFVKV